MPASSLRRFADNIGKSIDDPDIQAALERGVRERLNAETAKVEQAAGLTGAAQVASSQSQIARAFTDAFAQDVAREAALERNIQQTRLQALTQAANLDEQRFQFIQRLEFEREQQRRAEKAGLRNALIGAVGGIATGFVGSDLFGSFFSKGSSDG